MLGGMAARHPDSRIAAPPPGPSHRLSALLGGAAIVVVGAVVYFNSVGGVFLLDDYEHIVENRLIRSILPVENWLNTRRPVVTLSLAVNYALGGLDPRGYHVFNIAVHLLAGLALFGILRRTLLLDRFRETLGRSATGVALSCALLWLVHPLQTQSVTYLVQRGESMMGLFYLLALYCVIRGVQSARHSRPWYAIAVAACGAGMGCKAVMVSAPLVIFAYDAMFLGGSIAAALRKRWALHLCLAATLLILPALGLGSVLKTEVAGVATVGFAYKGVTPGQYAATQPSVILHYLRLCFWPAGQCLDYAWRPVESAREALLPCGAILLMILGTIRATARGRWPGFLGIWFFAILAPTSSFIPIKDLAFEHRMYLPSAAVAVAVVICAHRLVSRIGSRSSATALVVAGFAAVSVLGYATIRRNRLYRSDEAMWRDVVSKAPHNPRARLALGRAFERQGRIEDALDRYAEAARLRPTYAQAHANIGLMLTKLERLDAAIESLQRAVRLDRKLMKAHGNLADAYMRTARVDDAVAVYEKALSIRPNWVNGRLGYGAVLAMQNYPEQAIEHFRRAARIDPTDPKAHLFLGTALQETGRIEEAVREFQKCLTLEPQNQEARRQLYSLIINGADDARGE